MRCRCARLSRGNLSISTSRDKLDLTVVVPSKIANEQCWRSVAGSVQYHASSRDINKRSESKSRTSQTSYIRSPPRSDEKQSKQLRMK